MEIINNPPFHMGKLKFGICNLAEVRQLLDSRAAIQPSSDCAQSRAPFTAARYWMCEPSVKLLLFQRHVWTKSVSQYHSCQRWEVHQACVSASTLPPVKEEKPGFPEQSQRHSLCLPGGQTGDLTMVYSPTHPHTRAQTIQKIHSHKGQRFSKDSILAMNQRPQPMGTKADLKRAEGGVFMLQFGW